MGLGEGDILSLNGRRAAEGVESGLIGNDKFNNI